MYSVSPKEQERYRLRLMLLNVKGATSFENLRTNYSEAAKALGLLRGDEEWEECMREASAHQMPFQLRTLFVVIVCECAPGSACDLYERFKREMSEDFIFRFDNNEELGIEAGYADLERRLNQNGKSLSNLEWLCRGGLWKR
ncbi:hypothetical protein L596_030189 [Steinernema carpocapsae]|uniref:Uncharacterized protein n=1 Tax=Steinernema carpocapsae TaxID=34508 RepID=A0A4V5ZX77_STECR|nr:hypothetical protein L596_030189 [Steinernema carpocapsae]